MFSKPSPRFARKGHQQITGSDADEKDRIIAGVQFGVRFIGSTEVACANGTGSGNTEKPVAKVFDQLRRKANGKTQTKMILTLCSKSLSVSDEACGKLVASFPIAKITFCNIDKFYEKAFVFVAREKPENPFKAFVFTCESKGKAKEAYKALSLAFIINYESYQASLARGASNGNQRTTAFDKRSLDSTRDERNNTFFNGMAEAGYGMKFAEGYSESEQLHCNGVLTSPKESFTPVMNFGFNSSEKTSLSLPAWPIQNKTLLQVAEYRKHENWKKTEQLHRNGVTTVTSTKESCVQVTNGQESTLIPPIQNKRLLQVGDFRRHARSTSDPTQFGKTMVPAATPSLLAAGTPLTHATAPNMNSTDTEMEEEFTEFAESRSRSSSVRVVSNHHNI